MFFFRNTNWSRQFLDTWWNQTNFVLPFGQSKSGDNTALKHLISIMPKDEFKQHVRVPKMQCLFNSNLWRPSWRSCQRLLTLTKVVWQGMLCDITDIVGCVDYASAFVTHFYKCYVTVEHGLSKNLASVLWSHMHNLAFMVSLNTGVYARGDFMVHLAGLDDKKKWMQSVLKDTSSFIPDAQPPARPFMSSRKESLPLLVQ